VIACRGDTVYFCWRDDRSGYSHVYFARSNDGGQSFLPNVQVDNIPGSQGILPSLAVDDSGGIHVAYRHYNPAGYAFTYYAKSTDGGQSFLPSVRACDSLWRGQAGNASLAVSRDGSRIYVAGDHWDTISLGRSVDGGRTFLTPDIRVERDSLPSWHPSVAVYQDSIVMIAWGTHGNSYYVRFAKSTDGGASFSASRAIPPDSVQKGDPSIRIDSCGRVYLAFADGYGLGVAVSPDCGDSFPPRRVVPGSEAGGGHPSLSVTNDQRVHVAWEFYAGDCGFYDEVRMAYSSDGGVTFSAPVNPSDGPADSWENRPTIVAGDDGKVFFAWTDGRNDIGGYNKDIYFATGALASVSERPGGGRDLSSLFTVTNPTSGRAWIEFALRQPGRAVVEVLNATGRLVRRLAPGSSAQGRQVLIWDGCDNEGRQVGDGIYFVRLRVAGECISRKLEIIR
jgi:hypothetical protein